jgi:tRNA threonylcarbamoyladenosine biosynthesis protein TsaB
MLILTIRTDKPEAELGLYEGDIQVAYEIWHAHRQLAETIHLKIQALLEGHHKQLTDIQSVVVYKGPGSFTGLRIGLSVANALAASYDLPMYGADDLEWQVTGAQKIMHGVYEKQIMPEYGSSVHITPPKS